MIQRHRSKTAQNLLLGLACCGLVLSCGSSDSTTQDTTTTTLQDVSQTRLNELQYIGTHNSYHLAPNDELLEAERAAVETLGAEAADFGSIDEWEYSNAPLADQLAAGIRTFELDVWADPEGGLFADPLAPTLLDAPADPFPNDMDSPGFKVVHVVDVDTHSTCSVFIACLAEIKEFSDAEPSHVPIIVMVELKDEPLPEPINVTSVVPIDGEQMDALDSEIRSVFDEDQLLTPDDIRGDAPTLRGALDEGGWPMVSRVLGTVMFFMDNGGDYRLDYLDGHPSLEGRVLFTSAGVGQDDGAFAKINDPGDGSEISELVEAGYMVRTRADAGLEYSPATRSVALDSGAQIVSTDFPSGTMNSSDGYNVTFETNPEVRCNPVAALPSCSVNGFG